MKNEFKDAYLDLREGRYITYRTGEYSMEEVLKDGIYAACGFLGAGYAPQTIIYGQTPRLDFNAFVRNSAFIINVDGDDLCFGWEFVSFDKEECENGTIATVKLHNEDGQIDVSIKTLLDGTNIFTRWLEIANLSDKPRKISQLDIVAGGIQKTERPSNCVYEGDNIYRLGYMDASNWGTEGAFRWHELVGDGAHVVAGRFVRDRFRHPMFVLENKATGQNFIYQIGYSGGWRAEIDIQRDLNWMFQENLLASVKIGLDGFAPLAMIEPKETIVTPKIHMGMIYGDLDDACNSMHDHVRKSVVKHYTYWNAPLEVGIGGEMDMNIEGVLASIDYGAEFGAEYFIIDHGWQFQPDTDKTPYNWIPNTLRYEMGMDAIREKCHEKGMKFGLWMEPERAFSKDWPIVKEHPEFMANDYKMKPSEHYPDGPFAIYKKEVADAVFEMMDEIITKYKCEIFRLDHNMFLRSFNYRNGTKVYADFDYFKNFYMIMEKLRKKHPECIVENCASGGGRTDFGMMECCDHTWITDWQKAPRSFMITNGLSMVLPPEMMDRIITAQSGHLFGSFEFQSFQLLFGRITLNATTANGVLENPVQSEKLMRIIKFYKESIQKGGDSNVFHHTPCFDVVEPKGTGIIERAAKNGSYDVLGVFNLAGTNNYEGNIKLRGIDISKNYRVIEMASGRETTVSGWEIKKDGINVRVSGTMNAALYCFSEI